MKENVTTDRPRYVEVDLNVEARRLVDPNLGKREREGGKD